MMCRKKVAVFLVLLVFMMSLSACVSSEQDELYSRAMEDVTSDNSAPPSSEISESSVEPESESTAEPKEIDYSLSGTLTLKAPDDFYWNRWIKHFNKKYPNVEVKLVGVGTDPTTYAQQTIVELMGGEAPADLVDLNYLPYYGCVESGVFENLLTWMEEDPVVKKDELYTNVLDAVTYKDSAAGLPLAFLVSGMRLNKKYLEAAGVAETPETASFSEMID